MTTIPEVATTPEVMEREFSLLTAVTRLDFLSRRDNVVVDAPNDSADDDDDWASFKAGTNNTQLDAEEALELLALGEVVARKAHENRQLGIVAALRVEPGDVPLPGRPRPRRPPPRPDRARYGDPAPLSRGPAPRPR
jgi:hypothetical protein